MNNQNYTHKLISYNYDKCTEEDGIPQPGVIQAFNIKVYNMMLDVEQVSTDHFYLFDRVISA